MKTTRLFAIMMATAVLVSCSKEENSGGEKEVGHSKLTLNLKGEKSSPGVRSAGEPTQAEESTINDFTIFVFKADGTNDITPKEFTEMPANGKVEGLVISTAAKEVYVIANTAGSTEVQDALKAVTKKSELQAVVGRGFASVAVDAASTQTKTNLWMTGKNDADFTPVKDGNVSTAVTLKYAAAKLRITSVTIDGSVAFTPSKVSVYNAGGATRLIPADSKTSLIPSYSPSADAPFYVSGASALTMTDKPTIAGVNNEYDFALTGDMAIAQGKNQHYFYVFENDGVAFESKPTILTLAGTNGSGDPIYYSVLFKADPDGSLGYDDQIIERGNSYDIAMTIKKMGQEDPTLPALRTTVDVTITPAAWQTVTIDKVYE